MFGESYFHWSIPMHDALWGPQHLFARGHLIFLPFLGIVEYSIMITSSSTFHRSIFSVALALPIFVGFDEEIIVRDRLYHLILGSMHCPRTCAIRDAFWICRTDIFRDLIQFPQFQAVDMPRKRRTHSPLPSRLPPVRPRTTHQENPPV